MLGWLKRIGSHGSSRASGFRHLLPERRYRVVCAFTDHDGIIHPVGESWRFLRSTFLPYEDGLSLFVALDGGAEMQIRLQLRAEAEGPIVDALDRYIEPAPRKTDACR